MKKFISVLFIFLISSYSVFCKLDYTEDSPKEFSLGLSLTTDKYSYEIGFSSKEVSENSVTPGSIRGNELELYSQLSDNSEVYAERTSGIFVYWKIASNENVKISLGLEKPLTYDPAIEGESPSTIDWYASWEGDNPGSIGGDGKYEYLVRDNSANEIIPGIKLDPITGALSGTPEKIDSSADLTGKFTVKDGTGAYGTWDRNTAWYSPNVSDVIRYLDGVGETYKESFYTLRQSYSKTFFQPNNNTKLTFSIQGDLPPGLVLNTSTGRISGTFTGTFTNKTVILTATIPADDFNPTPITKTVTITFPGVGSFLEYEIVPTNLTINPLVIGRDIGRIDISQGLTGGSPDFTWTLEGDIPPGIRIEKDPNDSCKAYLVGIPNTVMDSGGLLTIRVNDSAGNTASADLVWNGIYDNLSVTGAENLKIPAQKAYVQIEEINIASIITVNGGSGNFQYSDGGTIKPYSISLSCIISGYTGAAAQAEKTGTITITDTVTGVTLNVPITVGEIEGGMIYTGNPSIDPGRIGTAFTSVNLKAGVSGGGTPKFTLASTPSSWVTGTINLTMNYLLRLNWVSGDFPLIISSNLLC